MTDFNAKDLIESFGYTHQLDEFDMKGLAGKAAGPLTYIYQIWDGYSQIKSLPTDMPKNAYTAEVSKIISKLVADIGIVWVGTILGGIIAGMFTGPGAAVGAVAGGVSAMAAQYALGDSTHEIVDKVVDALYTDETNDSAMQNQPQPQSPVQSQAQPTDKLSQLQKMIGANPDGIYGPETKAKLQAWQQQHGIKADGIPGPETYSTAGLAETKEKTMKYNTLADDIAALRDKLAIIENDELTMEAGATAGVAAITKAIWDIVRTGVYNTDDILKKLSIQFGNNLPPNIRQQVEYATKTVGGKMPVSSKSGNMANIAGDATKASSNGAPLSSIGGKTGEYVGKGQQTGGITSKTGNIIDGEFKRIDDTISAMSPNELSKVSQNIATSSTISAIDKQGIKQLGILNWIKQNPKKAGLIAGAIGLGVVGSMNDPDDASQDIPVSQSGGKRGDPEIMKQQELLNALTGSNLAIDGIWGPKTQSAADAWSKISSQQNATMQSDLANINKPKTVAESIGELRDLLASFE